MMGQKKNSGSFRSGLWGAIIVAFFYGGPVEASCVEEPYVGSICLTAGTYCPRLYREANGDILAINDFTTLYAVIGSLYGGDGRSTLALPDLRGRSAVHYGTGPNLDPAVFALPRGDEETLLSIKNLPKHSHYATFDPTGGSVDADGTIFASSTLAPDLVKPDNGAFIAQAGPGLGAIASFSSVLVDPVKLNGVVVKGTVSAEGKVSVADTGNGVTFSNLPPQLAMRYCIAVDGLFPPRE